MFDIIAHQNPYLRVGQNAMQAVLSIDVAADLALAPTPLALGIVLDRSGSMEGAKISAAREGAINVVTTLDPTMLFAVVTFSSQAQLLFGPALATPENKQHAIQSLRGVSARGGTAISTALNTVVETFGRDQGRATKILFLTDGKNESEQRSALEQAVARCAAARIGVHAWGIGTDWDEQELRFIADRTHGDADIIPQPRMIASAFADAFQELRKTALTNVRLRLWSPVGVRIRKIEQVYPQIISLGTEPDPTSPRTQIVQIGSFAAGDQRDYLLDLELPVYAPGQQFLVARPSITYTSAGTGEQEQKAERKGWVLTEWTDDPQLAAQIDDQVAHYTNQEGLADSIREGQAALASGDIARATRLLTDALAISRRTGNIQTTRLLEQIVSEDATGTVTLKQQVDDVARKTLAINAGRTTKLR